MQIFCLYSLLDVVIDQGFPLLKISAFQLERLEVQRFSMAQMLTSGTIHVVKRELILLRRMLWPQREVINQLLRDEHG